MNGRVLVRYKENAKKLGLSYEEYLQNGNSGKRYCSRCLRWKQRRYFKEYSYTKTYFSGVCKACSLGISAPSKVNHTSWGPSLRAAKKLGIEIKEYLEKREQGYRWCTDHKDWFDATEMLGGKTAIIRCNSCSRMRQQSIRDQKKLRKGD